jgi:hypothetical protein
MSVSINVDPIDIEEIDLHDGEDLEIDVYGSRDGGTIPCLGFITIESENDEIKVIISNNDKIKLIINNLENVVVEDYVGNPINIRK